MIETVVIATDGSRSVGRAVGVALDLALRFDAVVHALYVIDESDVAASPAAIREEFHEAIGERGERALADVEARAEREVTTAVREGRPSHEIIAYAREQAADVVALGTRGRHGEDRFLLGSVAERVVRNCPIPVLTVRHLEGEPSE